MGITHISWIVLPGFSAPAVLTERKDGTWIATSPDWGAAGEGKDQSAALSALAKVLDRRMEQAIAASRRQDSECR
jgi:hypothetical protein